MKLLLTADLHQHIQKYRQLVEVVQGQPIDMVCIAGDLLPKTGFAEQKKFFGPLRDRLTEIRATGAEVVLMFGNDDAHVLEPRLDELAAEGLCVNPRQKIWQGRGLTVCGMSHVRDYPFGYKHWCAPDGDFVQCPVQFCGEGVTMNENGDWEPIPDLQKHLQSKPSLTARLDALRDQLSPAELARSIWLIHQPPDGLGMDICGSGQRVGSPLVRYFIEDAQPLLVVSGHIHESPYQAGGRWESKVGRTTWVQPGQTGRALHYVLADCNTYSTGEWEISHLEHSLFK